MTNTRRERNIARLCLAFTVGLRTLSLLASRFLTRTAFISIARGIWRLMGSPGVFSLSSPGIPLASATDPSRESGLRGRTSTWRIPWWPSILARWVAMEAADEGCQSANKSQPATFGLARGRARLSYVVRPPVNVCLPEGPTTSARAGSFPSPSGQFDPAVLRASRCAVLHPSSSRL